MVNNTIRGQVYQKANILPSTTAAGGTIGATLQDSFSYSGTFVCNGVTPVTVAEPNVTANTTIIITLKTVGGTVSVVPLTIQTITVGTGFTVQGQASDTSTYNYKIFLA